MHDCRRDLVLHLGHGVLLHPGPHLHEGLRYLTNAVGNIIDIVVLKSLEGVLPKQAYEFFLFGGLTLVFMAIFILMSLRYK